ncbi:MAG: FecR domain-containing protein [Labilithrix sp.]|nr:FecR domain-containing protein [Labilithrix sp.]
MSTLRRVVAKVVRFETAIAVLTLGAALGAWFGVTSRGGRTVDIAGVKTTVGDLRSLHAEVFVRGREVRGAVRLDDGDDVKTAAGGRARVRLDDGTVVVVDGATELALRGERLTLTRGRVFVQAGASSRTEVEVRGTVATVVSSAAAFDAEDGTRGAPSVYCARGELVLASKGKSVHVPSGETATLRGDGAKVAPETAFDDWTGGLAVPWSGERAPASAIAELWATPGGGEADPGAPLVVRSEKVDVTIEGELAVTRTRTTYFNGSDRDVVADVRMALPEGAVVSRVARLDEGSPNERSAALGPGDRRPGSSTASRLEWAGGGWLRGTLENVRAGSSVDLVVDYVEWLSQVDGRATYRFPMASETESPMVGGLSVRVSSRSPAKWLSASAGAAIVDGAIELRRSDVRPTGDLVVELVPSVVRPGAARAYVEQAGPNEDPYLLVRTEVPDLAETGTTLALVVDTSSSVGPALLETERAAVDALLGSLGPKDAVVVLAADQGTAVVGPDKPSPVTPELRARIQRELAAVRAGGASNLGLGLERAADLLDGQRDGAERAGSGMVVYLGDGRPTVGETTARDLRRRLARRASGVPRLGAIAVGQGADRWMLAELVAGAGPVYEVLDRPDAARAASALVADALAPTLRDVSVVLGPTVDRVYPRDARTVLAGSTLTVAGRLRGALPREIALRYRRGTELVEETRALALVPAPADADVARRWARERIEESITHADGIEPAIALATKASLMTPWTGWFFDGATASVPWEDRLLGLSPALDAAFASKVEPAPPPPSLLLEPPAVFDGEASIEEAAEIAARHAIEDSIGAMVACRDARASIKPGVTGDLRVDVSVAATGRATKVVVTASRPADDDPVLDRCVRVVVDAIPFFAAGVGVAFTHDVSLPPGQASRRTECSVASTLPLAVRRGIWRARKAKATLDYAVAARACELPTWSDRRTLLGILVAGMSASSGTELVRTLSRQGETDAAAFVKQELVRQVDLGALDAEQLRRLLIDDEPKIDRALDAAYRAARTDEARLAVLRRFLRLAPHSPLGRRLSLSLLEATGDRPGLLEAIDRIRGDVFADAGLLAECASALRRLGMDAEGRRAFGELVERAPRDPWTLGYVGDRLRAEGLYEDALAAYQRLDAAMPDEPAVALRLALAHAGAGRLDVATRLLDRVAQTGGRGDDGRLGELASIVGASLIAAARQGSPGAETDALLARRLAQTALPDVASVILVRTPLLDDPVQVYVARRDKDKDELPADLDASAMGLSAVRIERGGGVARIRLRRAAGIAGGRPTRGLVTALVLGGERGQARLVTREVDVGPGDKGAELRWNGETFE